MTTEQPGRVAVAIAPSTAEISRVMAALGRRGGQVGGRRRAEVLTDKRRSEIAAKAAKARWDKKQLYS